MTSNEETVISLNGIGLTYPSSSTPVDALLDINLDIKNRELICLLGPSGCGKSTLLKLLAGFIRPTSGEILMDGNPIDGPDWHRGVVFQKPALYPWLNVEDNAAFGPKLRKVGKTESAAIVNHYLDKVGLSDFRKHRVYELSGGMQQRLSIARALVNNPLILLMDEPFGALDALTRSQMQILLRNIWIETKKTIFFITHDVDEALLLATRILVMSERPGRIIREFETDFTYKVGVENATDTRFEQKFRETRLEILDLISSGRVDYFI